MQEVRVFKCQFLPGARSIKVGSVQTDCYLSRKILQEITMPFKSKPKTKF